MRRRRILVFADAELTSLHRVMIPGDAVTILLDHGAATVRPAAFVLFGAGAFCDGWGRHRPDKRIASRRPAGRTIDRAPAADAAAGHHLLRLRRRKGCNRGQSRQRQRGADIFRSALNLPRSGTAESYHDTLPRARSGRVRPVAAPQLTNFSARLRTAVSCRSETRGMRREGKSNASASRPALFWHSGITPKHAGSGAAQADCNL